MNSSNDCLLGGAFGWLPLLPLVSGYISFNRLFEALIIMLTSPIVSSIILSKSHPYDEAKKSISSPIIVTKDWFAGRRFLETFGLAPLSGGSPALKYLRKKG
jgi:hypothetical protein